MAACKLLFRVYRTAARLSAQLRRPVRAEVDEALSSLQLVCLAEPTAPPSGSGGRSGRAACSASSRALCLTTRLQRNECPCGCGSNCKWRAERTALPTISYRYLQYARNSHSTLWIWRRAVTRRRPDSPPQAGRCSGSRVPSTTRRALILTLCAAGSVTMHAAAQSLVARRACPRPQASLQRSHAGTTCRAQRSVQGLPRQRAARGISLKAAASSKDVR